MDLASLELVRRRADLVPHARGSLARHLRGVAGVLDRWGQPRRVVLAGLLHSGYSTEAFHFSLFGRDERARVRELIGADAERLVLAFGGCGLDVLLAAAENDGGQVELATRWDRVTVKLERRDLADLMVIHAANLAEQTAGRRGGPGNWLATASRMIAAGRGDREVAPLVFGGGTEIVTEGAERSLRATYRRLLKTGSGTKLEAWESAALASSPVGEPLVVAGLVALAAGRGREAGAFGARALAAFDAWGTAWDKRLGVGRWRELAELVARDGKTKDRELDAAARRADEVLEGARRSPARIWAQLDAMGAFDQEAPEAIARDEPESSPKPSRRSAPTSVADDDASPKLPPRFAEYVAGLRTNAERPLLQFYPGLAAEPWHDAGSIPIVADLERLAPRIGEEARRLDPEAFQDEAEDIGRTGRWSVLFLLEMGRPNEAVLAKCPAIRSLIDANRMLTSQAGSMYFSRIDPRTRVAPHQGPTNLRLRCHLGIDVPDGCGIRVGGLTSTWREGRCIVFDDSFPHDVWNDSDRSRLVLVLDLWHPDLTDDEIALLCGLHRYGAASASVPKAFWERNDAARRQATRTEPSATPAPAPVPAPAPAAPADDAITHLRASLAERPNDASLHLRLGHELAQADRHAEAETAIRASIALDPSHAMAHNNLGWSRHAQGDDAEAIAEYQRALALDPTCGRARRNLATLFTNLGRFAEALALRQAELDAEPDNAPALAALVGAAMRAGELRMAADLAVKQAATCRGTRWYPTRRDDDPEMPASIPWARSITPSKLLHDIEQFEYLARHGILARELEPIIEAYDGVLDTLRPLGPDARIPLAGAALAQIGHVYNRIVHVRPTPRVARALSGTWDPIAVENDYLARRPNAVVVDNFLSDEAIRSLRLFCLESTVWSENRYKHGRLGSMFQDGFNCPLLIQIAEELRAALPRIIKPDLPARQIWGYKYAPNAPAETPHADFAFVNVNVWITPEDANLDRSTGGLDVYDVAAPRDWDFATYNSNAGVRIHQLLEARKARPRHIEYRYNRAMIFDSELFHTTPQIKFKGGYENRRMNVTCLYGARDGR